MIAAKLFANLLAQATPESARPHSMLNHHAKGFDYLNLHRTRELTVKVYMTRPLDLEHLTFEQGEYIVGPHDHRYAFETFVLAGSVMDITFRQGPAGKPYEAMMYDHVTRAFYPKGKRVRLYESKSFYRTGATYYHEPEDLHTLALARFQPTALLVLQYQSKPKQSTCYVESSAPSTAGLYIPPTDDDTRELILRARALGAKWLQKEAA